MNGTRTDSSSNVSERFWAKVDIRTVDECWPWGGYVAPHGYGGFWNGATSVAAHRQSFELANGYPAEGDVDHTCHNDSGCAAGRSCQHRACVNPAHLEDVTHRENMRRGQTGKTKARRVECMKGHPFTPENTFTTKAGDRLCRTCKRTRETNRRHEIRS